MSRDVLYVAPSESDGRSEQQAITNERASDAHERQPVSVNASSSDMDSDTEEAMSQSIRDRVYYAAKDGLPLALQSLLSNEKNEAVKNAYINQVGFVTFVHDDFDVFIENGLKSGLSLKTVMEAFRSLAFCSYAIS